MKPYYHRRHYEQLAHIVASMREDTPTIYSEAFCNELETKLAQKFQRDNPLFDRAKFLAACRRKDK